MKTFINIKYRKALKWSLLVSLSALMSVSCKDIYDNIKDFSVEEIVYPAKFDTIYGTVGFERVEIDLCKAGRVPAGNIKLGKAMKTVIEYDTSTIVIDSVCSWVNITGLKEPKLYTFRVYTADEYDDRSTPKEISLTPYTAQDRSSLGLAPPLIIESTSSALVEWRTRVSSSLFNLYSYEYEYKDRDSITHKGTGESDLPSFFVENIRKGNTTLIKMKCRIQPKLGDKLILDTVDWEQTIALNISDAAVPALFLKTPVASVSTDVPLTFEWVMTDEVTGYTLKLSRNSAFLPSETETVDVGNVDSFVMDKPAAQSLLARFNASVIDLYWTVVPTIASESVRTQYRQLRVISRDPRAVADMLDIVFNADGSAQDIAVSTQRCAVNRYKGTNPLDVSFNERYQRYMASFNPTGTAGSNPSVNESSFYQAYYFDNSSFRDKLSNSHSIELLVMINEDFSSTTINNEVKIFASQGGGGTGIQLGNKSSYNNEFVFQVHVNGGWRYIRSGVTPEKGRYYHVVGVWNKAQGKCYIYVDGEKKGELEQSGNFTFPSNVNTYWFCLGGTSAISGSTPSMANVMRGDIVIARIHSAPLTAEEITALYQQL
jgi:hypothetical protein